MIERKRIGSGYYDIENLNYKSAKEWVEYLTPYIDQDTEIVIRGFEGDDMYMELITYRLESDVEIERRINQNKEYSKLAKDVRYNNYLRLKAEFENEVPETDPLDVDIKGDLD